MPSPDERPAPPTGELVLALVLGACGVAAASFADGRPLLAGLAVVAWAAALLVFGAASTGRRLHLLDAPKAVPAALRRRRLRDRPRPRPWRRRPRGAHVRLAHPDPGGLWSLRRRPAPPHGRPVASVRRTLRACGRWLAGAGRRVTAVRVTPAAASVGLAGVVTMFATRTWVMVPVAVLAWSAAAVLLGLRWPWVLSGALGSMIAAAAVAAVGAEAAADSLAVCSYGLAWVACGMAAAARVVQPRRPGPSEVGGGVPPVLASGASATLDGGGERTD